MAEDFLDAVYGCLIGGAIGDAMGAPVENWHHSDIRKEHGKVERFLPGHRGITTSGIPGAITDDTALKHYMCLAIVRKGGRITPEDYARVWLEDLNPERLFFTERIALEKLKLGMSPWETGRGLPAADAAIMAVAPIGIINAADPTQAYQDAFNVSLVHQDGLECHAAATAAAGFAAAFAPGASVDGVLDAMLEHGTHETRRLILVALDLARDSGTVEAFAEGFYATMLDRSFPVPPGERWDKDRSPGPTSREVLPAVAAIFWLCGGDPNRCFVEGDEFRPRLRHDCRRSRRHGWRLARSRRDPTGLDSGLRGGQRRVLRRSRRRGPSQLSPDGRSARRSDGVAETSRPPEAGYVEQANRRDRRWGLSH